jgi:exopolysaccharide biosynthesis polyprenyl glycosylphosphotransferase
VLDERFVDTVIIASSEFERDAVSRMINDLRGYDVDVQLSAGLLDVTTSRINVSEVSGLPLIGVKGVSFAPWKRATKRAFDLAIGGIIMIVGLPVWLLLALAIKIDSRGPILYKQARVGRDGQPFGMFKFRSMCDDAEARLAELWRDNEADGPLFKMRDDPRVTRVGRWMRRHSIDEFPQLLNVLRGEMSLVGPRPPLLHETHNYNDDQWHRMEVLPGMTGLWQVSGRSRLTFDEMVHLDLFYIENWSVGFDLGLMARTVSEVLFADGAY